MNYLIYLILVPAILFNVQSFEQSYIAKKRLGNKLSSSNPQTDCNCQEIKRDDGTLVNNCESKLVTYNNSLQIGMNMIKNKKEYFVAITIRFKNIPKTLNGNVSLRLADNELFSLPLTKEREGYIDGSHVSFGIYKATSSDIKKLKKSELKTISFQFNDESLHTMQAKKNTQTLMHQTECLKN